MDWCFTKVWLRRSQDVHIEAGVLSRSPYSIRMSAAPPKMNALYVHFHLKSIMTHGRLQQLRRRENQYRFFCNMHFIIQYIYLFRYGYFNLISDCQVRRVYSITKQMDLSWTIGTCRRSDTHTKVFGCYSSGTKCERDVNAPIHRLSGY